MAPKRPSAFQDERFVLSFSLASASGDTTLKLFKGRRRFQIDQVRYVNPTGLATSASNYFNLRVLIGATLAANWSTETGEEGTIAADTFVDLVNASAEDRLGALDAVISINLDETGAATLPAGQLQIEGKYL